MRRGTGAAESTIGLYCFHSRGCPRTGRVWHGAGEGASDREGSRGVGGCEEVRRSKWGRLQQAPLVSH